MKLSIRLMLLAIATLTLISCSDDKNRPIYDGSAGSQTLVRFGNAAYNFEVPRDSSTTMEIQVQASTISDADRTFNVTILHDDGQTTANPATYSVPTTVTIPAGKYIGILEVYGEDNGLVEISPVEIITLELSNPNPSGDIVMENTITTLTQYEVCPIPEDFLVGDYMLTNVTQSLGPSNSTDNFAEEVVTLSIGDSPTQRVFTTTPLVGYGPPTKFAINLVCGQFIFQKTDISVKCTNGIFYGPAPNDQNTTYDKENEQTTYVINYNEDLTNDCGGSGLASFKLTQVN